MKLYSAKSTFQHDEAHAVGVLVANLGTPDEPTEPALRRYLRQFLSDPRVIEIPRWRWWPILYGIVLRTRPKKSAAAYSEVWEEDGSPLLSIGQRQAAGIRQRLQAMNDRGPFVVELGMRYGNPSIPAALRRLRESGARRILVLPLYPQYSASTTGSTFDAVARELMGWRWVPELRMVGQYHDEPVYIQALARSIREHWEREGRGERLLFSYHGVPERYLLDGDPYHCQCLKTSRLVAEELGLEPGTWDVTFQSRFGNEEWLKPYTDETVTELARSGVKHLDVVCPGFSADCLETLEEIAGENREYFEESGGERLSYIPALNDRPDHLDALAALILQHGQGWREVDGGRDPQAEQRARAETAERARARGAAS
ncbi:MULTISPECIES: ferrochelatase [unclassified Halorhodospira]|uniref:ferrochelatase n=1 Tax=unclassified Halorhodospira TaxID=2626748 RepID=UPI001EE8DADA|nr:MULTISPECIES: ferrochelatase [unclassified Halorhodospira]MCG5541643.1 ferrochelatase [Halorhodospira sp. M39old]MCG5546579.1 ferrochelatase [Halorhodospira sp. M38]